MKKNSSAYEHKCYLWKRTRSNSVNWVAKNEVILQTRNVLDGWSGLPRGPNRLTSQHVALYRLNLWIHGNNQLSKTLFKKIERAQRLMIQASSIFLDLTNSSILEQSHSHEVLWSRNYTLFSRIIVTKLESAKVPLMSNNSFLGFEIIKLNYVIILKVNA